jgi:hypothetical protein
MVKELSRAALIEAIIRKLSGKTKRTLAAIDIHLERRPGEHPNWRMAVDGAETTDVINAYAALSHFDLKDEAKAR